MPWAPLLRAQACAAPSWSKASKVSADGAGCRWVQVAWALALLKLLQMTKLNASITCQFLIGA